MYLLLVDQDFVSSTNIQEMVRKSHDNTDIVQCYSTDALLNIAEKLSPDIIVTDFDLIEGDYIEYFRTLRSQCAMAHLLVLINPDNFENLNVLIEQDGIDAYMVKPINHDDFLARIHITTRKKGSVGQKKIEPPIHKETASIRTSFDSIEIEETGEETFHGEQLADEALFGTKLESTHGIPDSGEEKVYEGISETENGFTSNFDDESDEPDDRQNKPVNDGIKSFEDILNGKKEEFSTWDLQPNDYSDRKTESNPAVVRPAEEFLSEFAPRDSSDHATDSAVTDDQYFDQIFHDKRDNVEKTEPTGSPRSGQERTDYSKQSYTAPLTNRQEQRQHFSSIQGEDQEFMFEENEWRDDYYNREQTDDYTGYGDKNVLRGRREGKQKPDGSGFARFFSVIGNIIFGLLLLMMAVISFFLIQGKVLESVPQVAGYQVHIHMNGNMNPEFASGSLTFVREIEPEQIAAGDIITFHSQTDSDLIFTSRVIGIDREDGQRFLTRGDANSFNDSTPVLAVNIIGRVTGSLPYAGYVMDYAQTRQGLIVLIFVPGILIIVFQLVKIIKNISRGGQRRRRET